MKKILLFLSLIIFSTACLPEDVGIKTTITLKNESDATITISSSDFDSDVVMKPRSQADVKINSSTGTFLRVNADNGWLSSVIEEQDGKKYVYTIVLFEYLVEYKITGTAKKVDVTYHNENDGTSQVSEVPVPWNKGFKNFKGNYAYIAAQNLGETGTVKVAIYYKGREWFKSESEGKYVIAKASGSLEN